MRPIILLLCVCLLPACESTRTVVAGPQNISDGSSDYNPEQEARSQEIGRQAATSGVVGQFGSGGSSFNKRFGTFDPHGYGKEGLNAMNEKVYGGKTSSQDMKSFSQTKDFLAKRYTNTGEIGQKESSTQGLRSWLGGKKANTDKLARETGQDSSESGRVLANRANDNDGRTIRERTSREADRVATTGDFYPAKKVLDQGADAPKIIGEGSRKTNESVTRLIKSRPRDNPASVEDIRQLLGKTD